MCSTCALLLHGDDLSRPAILETALDPWPDPSLFSVEQLSANLGHAEWEVGVDDLDPNDAVTIQLDNYLEYACHQRDDSPLYIFDDAILDDIPELAASCAAPPGLPADLWRTLPDRPPFQWVLIGAERSGSAPHIDPAATAAWNTLVSGLKRWVFYPPDVADADVYAGAAEGAAARESASHWLHACYPRLASLPGTEVVQRPGESVFVPHGWWHTVVNLQLSVAVTANFVHSANAEAAQASLAARDGTTDAGCSRGKR